MLSVRVAVQSRLSADIKRRVRLSMPAFTCVPALTRTLSDDPNREKQADVAAAHAKVHDGHLNGPGTVIPTVYIYNVQA